MSYDWHDEPEYKALWAWAEEQTRTIRGWRESFDEIYNKYTAMRAALEILQRGLKSKNVNPLVSDTKTALDVISDVLALGEQNG